MAHRNARRGRGASSQATDAKAEDARMSAATMGLVLAGAVGTALGYLFGTESGTNMRRSISKRADALMKSYNRGSSRSGRFRAAGAAA